MALPTIYLKFDPCYDVNQALLSLFVSMSQKIKIGTYGNICKGNMDFNNYCEKLLGEGPSCVQTQTLFGNTTNRFVYVKQNHVKEVTPQQILVNPHFMKKVYVNPQFGSPSNQGSSRPAIHLNPHVYNFTGVNSSSVSNMAATSRNQHTDLPPIFLNKSRAVHVNPNFKTFLKKETPQNMGTRLLRENVAKETVLLTKTKLIRAPVIARRNSIKSKYKIIRSTSVINTGRKGSNLNKPRYKLDYRTRKTHIKTGPVKSEAVVATKHPHALKNLYSFRSQHRTMNKSISKSKYKFIRRVSIPQQQMEKAVGIKKTSLGEKSFVVKKFKLIRKTTSKVVKSSRKLKKCNIPCPYYRKYGICKGKDNGRCCKKHDPDQIALCTKFLQGACLKEKCLLSHKVLPGKMPTCKYYLEGSCSKERCPYLHVKISAKADICPDFLEGFCEKAAECHKRHQYLCPEYEKHGKCLKQRCPYPHGKMVRRYLVHKQKFAKNCSEPRTKPDEYSAARVVRQPGNDVTEKARYYISKQEGFETKTFETLDVRSRPRLGTLPSFIPFDEL
ncbi:zinc finger CCCH domain-containing protein 3 [Cylas formicarius]|uniref:zinc finger CCCH domain-containing protein 3 n=1 Tax=Cylas formicarius TaxID=197179 RepID=UPI00295836CB|nr:zinc finger CCCH domain-containing protein 3 [Cylas formicarius]